MADYEWVEITVKIPRPIAEWLESLVRRKGWPRHQIVTAGLANQLCMMAGARGREAIEEDRREEDRYREELETLEGLSPEELEALGEELEAWEEDRSRGQIEALRDRYREHVEWLVDDFGETHALRIWDLQDPSKEHLLEIAIALRETRAKLESWVAQDFRALRTPPIEL